MTVDSEHPLRFERGAAEGLKPYVRVRGDLWALVKRALFYDLVALGQTERVARRGLVRRALGRRLLSHVPGERNRGALSVDPVPDPSPAIAARAWRERKLPPSLSLDDLERAAPSGEATTLSMGGRRSRCARGMRAPAAVLAADRRPAGRAERAADPARLALARPFRPDRLSRRQDRRGRDPARRGAARGAARKSGSRRGSSSRSAGSIPISPAPDFASRRWSR